MSRPYVGIVFAALACVLASTASPALAQQPAISANPYRGNGIYAPPGHYGVMFGTPSYGTVRTTSAFSSPFGVGYGYGYPAARILPETSPVNAAETVARGRPSESRVRAGAGTGRPAPGAARTETAPPAIRLAPAR